MRKPGGVLVLGLGAAVGAALLPAGLWGRPVPVASWIAWALLSALAIAITRAVAGSVRAVLRQLRWVAPTVLVLALPTALIAAGGRGWIVAAALAARSLTSLLLCVATITVLGERGLIDALRALRVPERLVDTCHGMLVGLNAIARQTASMLRARTARGTGSGPWRPLLVEPIASTRWFGRLVGTVLLRSVERAEALERARRARGVDA